MTEEQKKQTFEEELFPHIDALHTFAYHMTYDATEADDLVQETYLKAFKFIDKYEKGTNAKAWLFKILKNAYINQYRKRSKRPTKVDFEEALTYQETSDKSKVQYVDLRSEIFDDMLGDEVTVALNSLPFDFKTVILLCDIEGFTYEEISKIIDIPIGTVRSRLFRARNMLKDKLQKYAATMGYEDRRGERNKTK